jgi:type II secretory pathway component GspD/PulD (secretin)
MSWSLLLLSMILVAQDFPRSLLRPTNTAPVSVDITQAKAGFETLGRMAGVNVLFDSDFMDGAVSPAVRIQGTAIFDALNTLSTQTHNFVEVLDSQSIIVSPDNPAKHSLYDSQIIKTFYVTNGPIDLVNLVSLIRLRLRTRYASQSLAAPALIVRETIPRVNQAEEIIRPVAKLKPGTPTTIAASNALRHVLTQDANGTRIMTPDRGQLQTLAARPVSFRMTNTSQAVFENIARTGGLNIIFDRDFRSANGVAFNVENVDALEALDLLSLQTKNFWQALDEKTILVAPDTEGKRRDIGSLIVKRINLSGTGTYIRMTELATILRTLFNMRFIALIPTTNTMVIRATPFEMALSEKIIDNLRDTAGEMTASAEIPTGSESSLVLRRRSVRSYSSVDSELRTKLNVPVTFETKPSVRASFEDLAKAIGVRVTFDNAFQDISAPPAKLQTVNAADALDFLSLHTGNVWQMAGAGAIVVAPDTQKVVQQLQEKSSKTIKVTNLNQKGVMELANALKSVLSLSQVEPATNAIQVNDTQENIALAEKIVAELDRPGSQ